MPISAKRRVYSRFRDHLRPHPMLVAMGCRCRLCHAGRAYPVRRHGDFVRRRESFAAAESTNITNWPDPYGQLRGDRDSWEWAIDLADYEDQIMSDSALDRHKASHDLWLHGDCDGCSECWSLLAAFKARSPWWRPLRPLTATLGDMAAANGNAASAEKANAA